MTNYEAVTGTNTILVYKKLKNVDGLGNPTAMVASINKKHKFITIYNSSVAFESHMQKAGCIMFCKKLVGKDFSVTIKDMK